ncbi:HETS-like protein [Fusarium agapanthi]|uniref:HETS-like protein n=1 Tax=Fusarium agapanthi TaxID=1803897 RepID=A0A9P5E4B3_9HYPO|nr:HETS-like protein [Fusarium agapanthi]
MAEIFATVTGAISIAGLFNNCVDCFNYVQIARHFGEDFSPYQLRLDVAKCRLARWGASIDINNDRRFSLIEPADPTVVMAQDILKEIGARFEAAYKVSRRYKTRTTEKGTRICTEADLSPVSQRVHTRFDVLTKQRCKSLGLMKKTGWALYDKSYMGRMIGDIITSIEDLEKVFPSTPQVTRQLVEMEIEEINDEQELELIRDVTEGLYPVLSNASKDKIVEIASKNTAGKITGQGRVNIGNTFVTGSFSNSRGIRVSTVNHVDEVNTTQSSRVNIGNTWGGKGFWD